ncbi:ribonuclease J [Candidatus Phytoplasma australiense]|uniref:Metallo-Beta-Lactamase Family Protein n=1 Tax=Strawberry lethal yellows phytoplasma (CPA) str. NZSb11 TaxID=980422 RepID=R4RZQ9_PHYAS|nr:ribonuclease J [Candidatus Phytoplasma australiense]AGL89938.1 Metallo-Beta-Lactamase Family Protein [Strawberry lethal yellows phytoplasma (CPA) str. NZSb11]
MIDIKFFALGGLGENGKNFYLLQINESCFIIDAGLKYPSVSLYGIDAMIADYHKLESMKDKIKGVFLTSAFETNLGAVPYFIKEYNLPIYTSYFTMEVLKNYFASHKINYQNLNLNVIKTNEILRFKDVEISFFATSQLIPETLGISFQTSLGAIVYTGELKSLESQNQFFQTNLTQLTKSTQQKVLAFLPASQRAFNYSYDESQNNFDHKISNYFINYSLKPKGIIVVASLAPDLFKIQKAITLACKLNFKVAILGNENETIIDVALKKEFLKIPDANFVKLNTFEEHTKHNQLVVFLFGKHFATLQRLQQMANKTDPKIHLNSQDLILLMSQDMAGIAKMQSQTLDTLSRHNIKSHLLIKDLSLSESNYEQNLKIMLNFLKPRYIIPVMGEYRHQYQVKKIAQKNGFKSNQIFLLENGSIWRASSDKEPFVENKVFSLNEILIDGTPVADGKEFIMKDREFLAADGVVILVVNVNAKYKKIVGEPKIVSKGFLEQTETNNIFAKLKDVFDEQSAVFLTNKYLKWNDFKKHIRESISKFLFKETKKRPIIIPIFISVRNE